MIKASQEDVIVLDLVPCICYPIWFEKNKVPALIDPGSEVNTMTLEYALKLGLKIYFTNVGVQKINNSTLKTFKIILASFQVENKLGEPRFFQETFLLIDLSMEVVLGMPFLTFNNANIQFAYKELTGRFYITVEALPTTKQVEIMDRKEFAKAALDEHVKAFVVHMTFLLTIAIHLARKA